MSEFIFDDSEIPDLVLETVIGFLAEVTPVEKWGEIRAVSKRWNRISKPVLKEAFERSWPKFVVSRDREAEVSKDRRSARTSKHGEHWAIVQPLPLSSLFTSARPSVGVRFKLATTLGGLVGFMVVSKSLFSSGNLEIWNPYGAEPIDGMARYCLLMTCSALLETFDGADKDGRETKPIGTVQNVQFDVIVESENVRFLLNGNPQCEWKHHINGGEGRLAVSEMKQIIDPVMIFMTDLGTISAAAQVLPFFL